MKGTDQSRGGWSLLSMVILLAVLIAATALLVTIFSVDRSKNGLNSIQSLKAICNASVDFRMNDSDGNGIPDYWTGDVAGLHFLIPQGKLVRIGLIDQSIAQADGQFGNAAVSYPGGKDADPAGFKPQMGYHFAAFDHYLTGGKAATFRLDTDPPGTAGLGSVHNLHRFGFMAYPVDLRNGQCVFIVDDDLTLLKLHIAEAYECKIERSGTNGTPRTTIRGSGSHEIDSMSYPERPGAVGFSKFGS